MQIETISIYCLGSGIIHSSAVPSSYFYIPRKDDIFRLNSESFKVVHIKWDFDSKNVELLVTKLS